MQTGQSSVNTKEWVLEQKCALLSSQKRCLYTSELQDKKNDKNNYGSRLKKIVSQSYNRTFQKRQNKNKARQIQVIHFKASLLGLFYH